MPRRGAIDVGTNSVRLLVADVPDAEHARFPPSPILQRLAITRLGEDLTAGGLIGEAAAARTAAAVAAFVAAAAEAGAGELTIAGTYALRAAANPDALLSRIPHPVRILSGEEEARLGYAGVLAGLGGGARRLRVIDIGGGSVELTYGDRGRIEAGRSVPAGAVTMTERFLEHDPPLDREIAALRAHLAGAVCVQFLRTDGDVELVGVGGTITTMAAVAQRLSPYDPRKVHGFRLSRAAVDRITADLASRTTAERRRLRGLQPERADIIVAGALVLQYLLSAAEAVSLTVSEADLLWALVVEPPSARSGS